MKTNSSKKATERKRAKWYFPYIFPGNRIKEILSIGLIQIRYFRSKQSMLIWVYLTMRKHVVVRKSEISSCKYFPHPTPPPKKILCLRNCLFSTATSVLMRIKILMWPFCEQGHNLQHRKPFSYIMFFVPLVHLSWTKGEKNPLKKKTSSFMKCLITDHVPSLKHQPSSSSMDMDKYKP